MLIVIPNLIAWVNDVGLSTSSDFLKLYTLGCELNRILVNSFMAEIDPCSKFNLIILFIKWVVNPFLE